MSFKRPRVFIFNRFISGCSAPRLLLRLYLCLYLLTAAACVLSAAGQTAPAATPPDQTSPASTTAEKTTPEMSSRDEAPTFKVNVRLVLLRVVVRDQQGHPVGNLHKEDFQLFDNRKQQVISQFSVEQPGSQIAREQKATEIPAEGTEPTKTANVAERFIGYVFDDVHLTMQDLALVRIAAEHRMQMMQPTDRAAIFTTSGEGTLDFTEDRGKLHEALLRLQPRPIAPSEMQECPYMSYYMANLIVNQHDAQALDNARRDALQCSGMGASAGNAAELAIASQTAQTMAETTAQQRLALGDSETHLVLRSLKDIVRRMSAAPGQRIVVLVSPGFITPFQEQDVTDIIDYSVRQNVIVSAVDARGLYVPSLYGDVSRQNLPNVVTSPQESVYESLEETANDDVLLNLAESAGGTFFHNNNDLENGLKQAAESPEYYYVLGYSPQNMKFDGAFHGLTVKLAKPAKLTIQARKGYYAPKQAPNAKDEAREEIQEAIFSQEEMHDLPIDLHTQFFKASDEAAKLSVLVHVDVKRMHFQKTGGRNNNDLTIAAAVFDRNGSFISGNEKILEMHWKDETLEHKLDRGVTLKSSFDVKPGSYLVRLVVRDNEGLIAAENGPIEIP
ncbi:MAG: VWA domain-containing protein [Acidobacteriaceae bacterium]|nr:VWA domain-containing protein [Acidobacteriaceae bacterium]